MYNLKLFSTKYILFITFSKYNIFININKYINFKNNLFKINNLYKLSLGIFGFKGKQKYTPLAINIIIFKTLLKLIKLNIYTINIVFKGVNNYKYIIIKNLLKYIYSNKFLLNIESISDISSISYNYNKFK